MGARPAREHRRRRPGVERNAERKGIDLVDGNGRHFTPSLPLMCGGAIVADMTRRVTPFIAMLPCLLAATPTLAHTGDVVGGFVGGLAHPVLGPITSRRWWRSDCGARFSGLRRSVLLPVVFPLVMAFGGALGILGVPLPGTEIGIAISAVLLGLAVVFAVKPPIWMAAVLVGVFAIFHGHAHGAELPAGADALAYSLGFVVATGLLHLAGIALGLLARWPAGRLAVRGAGAMIALAGVIFLARLA